MATGTIAKLTDRGYGFIKAEGEEKEIFFHASEMSDGEFNNLAEGDAVQFEISQNDKGPFASNVAPVEA